MHWWSVWCSLWCSILRKSEPVTRVQLFYKDISEIVGSDGFSVVRLTDKDELQVISVICDKAMTEQIGLRVNSVPGRGQMLVEVLVGMLIADGSISDLELMVYDISDGQYRVTLLNKRTLSIKSIRMSDAVLLHITAQIPLYMDEALMQRQSTPFCAVVKGISIPINTLDTEHLNRELERAIDAEDYRLASNLHEELKRRKKT